MFTPTRSDAVFCSAKCRQAIYWQRHTDYMKPNDRPTYVVVLRPEPNIDGSRALRAALKFMLRKYGLRVVRMREEQAKDIATA
jgi:hypothetical protein